MRSGAPFFHEGGCILSGKFPGYQTLPARVFPSCARKYIGIAALRSAPRLQWRDKGFAGRLSRALLPLPILPTWGHLTGFAIFSLHLEAQT